jgi:hypothetical protein
MVIVLCVLAGTIGALSVPYHPTDTLLEVLSSFPLALCFVNSLLFLFLCLFFG